MRKELGKQLREQMQCKTSQQRQERSQQAFEGASAQQAWGKFNLRKD